MAPSGTLLLFYSAQKPISRASDQPPNGGANDYAFTMNPRPSFSWWQPIDSADLIPPLTATYREARKTSGTCIRYSVGFPFHRAD